MKGRSSLASKATSSKNSPKRERFASKYVQRIMNDAIENSIRKSKDPNNLKKLAEKMKSNVLQKVSLGSTIVFMPSDNAVSHYDQEIAQVEKEIALQIARLESSLGNSNNHSSSSNHSSSGSQQASASRLSLQPSIPSERGYVAGQFESTIHAMQNKVRLISSELAEARNGAEDRLLSIENTVEVVRDNIDSVINRQQQQVKPAPTAFTSSQQQPAPGTGASRRPGSSGSGASANNSVGSGGGSATKKRSEAAGVASGKQDPLQSMYNHLQTR